MCGAGDFAGQAADQRSRPGKKGARATPGSNNTSARKVIGDSEHGRKPWALRIARHNKESGELAGKSYSEITNCDGRSLETYVCSCSGRRFAFQARKREQESQLSPSLPESPNTPSLSEREIFSALTWPAFSQEHSQLALMKTLCRPVDELIRDLRSITNQVGVPRDQTTRE